MRRRRLAVAGALAGMLALTTASCMNKATEPFRDSSVASRNDRPADVMTFPDGFSNISAKCDGPNRVYVAFKGDDNRAALAVAPNDPRCR